MDFIQFTLLDAEHKGIAGGFWRCSDAVGAVQMWSWFPQHSSGSRGSAAALSTQVLPYLYVQTKSGCFGARSPA